MALGDAATAYHAHFESIRPHLTIESYSRVDGMSALRLRIIGHSREAVIEAVRQYAPHLRESTIRRDRQRYAQYTVNYAFGMAGDAALLQYEKYRKAWILF